MDVFADVKQRSAVMIWTLVEPVLRDWLADGTKFYVPANPVECILVSIEEMRRKNASADETIAAERLHISFRNVLCLACEDGRRSGSMILTLRRPTGSAAIDRIEVHCEREHKCGQFPADGRQSIHAFKAAECASIDAAALWEAAGAHIAACNTKHPPYIVEMPDEDYSPTPSPPPSSFDMSLDTPAPPPPPKPTPPAKKPAAAAPKKPAAAAPKKPPPAKKPVELKRAAEPAPPPTPKRVVPADTDEERTLALFSTVSALLHDDSEKMAFRMIARIGIERALTAQQVALLRSAYARWIGPASIASDVLDAYVASADDTPLLRWARVNAAACKHF